MRLQQQGRTGETSRRRIYGTCSNLARILIKPDDGYTMEQEDRGQEMLDLVRSSLTRRSTAAILAA